MAVSATSDAFRWLFSPGCLGVAWNLLPRNPSSLPVESRLLYSPVRSNAVATTQSPSFVAGVTGRTRVIRQSGTISPVLLINLYKFSSRDTILHPDLPAFLRRELRLWCRSMKPRISPWISQNYEMKKRLSQFLFLTMIRSEWWCLDMWLRSLIRN